MSRVVPKRAAMREERRPVDPVQLRQRRVVGQRDVLEGRQRLRRDDPADDCPDRLGVPLAGLPARATCRQRAMEHRGGGALGRRQVDVARAHCEPVGFAHGGAGDHGRQGEVGRHPGDDPKLLGILHPEVGAVRPDQAEEDRDDGRDAVEVARARRPFERPAEQGDAYPRVEARRIDVRDGRSPDEVGPLLGADVQVAGLVPRVLREVGRIAELARVDEDRDGHAGALGAGPCDQRAVASMEPAHRRDQAQGPRRPREGVGQLRSGADDEEAVGRFRIAARAGPRGHRSRSSGIPPANASAVPARSATARPRTSSRMASSMRVACASPGNVPASTSAR